MSEESLAIHYKNQLKKAMENLTNVLGHPVVLRPISILVKYKLAKFSKFGLYYVLDIAKLF